MEMYEAGELQAMVDAEGLAKIGACADCEHRRVAKACIERPASEFKHSRAAQITDQSPNCDHAADLTRAATVSGSWNARARAARSATSCPATLNDVHIVLNIVHEMHDTLPSSFKHLSLFLRRLAFQQFWLHRPDGAAYAGFCCRLPLRCHPLCLLLYPALFFIVAALYFGLTLGGKSQSTPGMRMAGIAIRRIDGQPMDFMTAVVHLVLFWIINAPDCSLNTKDSCTIC
eukprot:gene11330-15156_t